ncbi:MAG: pilin [Gammaproteobacteria bacterium]
MFGTIVDYTNSNPGFRFIAGCGKKIQLKQSTKELIQMKNMQQGFTLIELMIVVAIIGILAAVAIPSYQDYTARAQVSEGISLTSQFKTSLAEYYASGNDFSGVTPTLMGGTTAGKYVSGISFTNGGGGTIQVIATFGNNAAAAIDAKTFAIETEDGGNTWACGNDAGAAGAIANQIEAKYMPGSCK